ncbi:hypothetical protein [Palleronia rufa]|uniref:hypothetical protein n=1 Tax=Palleronia rufa TaxID=1530186 RepID=UPI00126887BE|nr:hypothetical protein [Palleronia rufa]
MSSFVASVILNPRALQHPENLSRVVCVRQQPLVVFLSRQLTERYKSHFDAKQLKELRPTARTIRPQGNTALGHATSTGNDSNRRLE